MSIQHVKHPIIIVIGPTASGKTDFSYELAKQVNGEIVNADLGQFYTQLTIGVAKPEWQSHSIKAHLFDILDQPKDFTVHEYAHQVRKVIDNITQKGKTPIIVGGSLFYVKSLIFPTMPLILDKNSNAATIVVEDIPQEQLWQELHEIDPQRARNIHPNDGYRLRRALDIWNKTQTLPSLYSPQFSPEFPFLLVALNPDKRVLYERICSRTQMMLENGWLFEAQDLMGTTWEDFIESKGMIGYKEIFKWLNRKNEDEFDELIERIQINTLQYAKRQITFMKSFLKQIPTNNDTAIIFECDMAQDKEIVEAKRRFEELNVRLRN